MAKNFPKDDIGLAASLIAYHALITKGQLTSPVDLARHAASYGKIMADILEKEFPNLGK